MPLSPCPLPLPKEKGQKSLKEGERRFGLTHDTKKSFLEILFLVKRLTSKAWAWGIHVAESRGAGTRHSACRMRSGATQKLPQGVSTLEDTNISPNGEKEALTQNGPRDLIQNLSFMTTGRWKVSVLALRNYSQEGWEWALKSSP